LHKSKIISQTIPNITLRAIQPLDIVVTKIRRLNSRDAEDIKTCIHKCHLTKEEIWDRAQMVLDRLSYSDDEYLSKLNKVINDFF
jgi:hypothetical protein